MIIENHCSPTISWESNPHVRLFRAWVFLCLALGLHVTDEATTGFLSVYNPTVIALRKTWGWVPMPVFSFEVWLIGLILAVAALLGLSVFVLRGARWMRPLAYLFAALMIAVSPPLIERGNLGWFKSEPLAILMFVAASYLLLTVFDKERDVSSKIFRAAAAGFCAGYSSAAWGGGDYFTAAFGLLLVILPFVNVDLSAFSPARF